jgi:hypothetical protein
MEQAQALKAQGTTFYNKCEFEKAIECYSEASTLQPQAPGLNLKKQKLELDE